MNTQEFTQQMDAATDLLRQAYTELAKAMTQATLPGRQQLIAVDEGAVSPENLQLDAALLAAAPVVVAPVHSEFFPLQENGHRFVFGSDGIYLEARRPWLYIIHRIAPIAGVKLPYGAVTPKAEMAFGSLGKALPQLQEFAKQATVAAPLEAAAAVLWNSVENTWRIEYPKVIGEATSSSISYHQVEPGPDEHLVIDLHSHGAAAAFFSETDDQDDAGSVKISGVYGNLGTGEPTCLFRMCVLGITIKVAVPAEKVFA